MRRLALFLACIACLRAAEPVGSMICVSPVEFNGREVHGFGLYFWPVLANDEVATTQSTGTLVLKDKSRIVFDRGTRVQLGGGAGKVVIAVKEGQIGYTLSPGSPVRIMAGGSMVDSRGGSGIVVYRAGKLKTSEGRMKFEAAGPDPAPSGLPSLGAYLPKP